MGVKKHPRKRNDAKEWVHSKKLGTETLVDKKMYSILNEHTQRESCTVDVKYQNYIKNC